MGKGLKVKLNVGQPLDTDEGVDLAKTAKVLAYDCYITNEIKQVITDDVAGFHRNCPIDIMCKFFRFYSIDLNNRHNTW